MRIVLGNDALNGPGGTETYTLTVAEHLQRLGHGVWIHANDQGLLADQAREDGLRVPERPAGLPPEVDAVVASDAITALQLAERYPVAPLVLVGHSDLFDLSLPPRLDGVVAALVVMYDRVEQRLTGMQLGLPMTRLAQPVDTEVFRPLRPLPVRAGRVLVYGNYMRGERMAMIERACATAGLECEQVGGHALRQRTLTPAQTLAEADIVIGKARVIIEAMAAGRAAYALDHNGGDGWVTAETYAVQAADNFGGQATDLIIDEHRLTADLAAYDAGMGTVNRDLAIRHHSAVRHAADLATLLGGLLPRPAPVAGPLDEVGRLVRSSWNHERRAYTLNAQVERLEVALTAERASRLAAATDETEARRQLEAAVAATHADAQAAIAHARACTAEAEQQAAAATQRASDAEAEAAFHASALGAFKGTRRYRFAQRLAAPLDRLRRRPRTPPS